MILSMTGYASRTVQLGAHLLQLEIRSVNHRFLDLTFKLAEEIKHFEPLLRSMITDKICRGKVDVKIYLKENKAWPTAFNLNYELLNQYLATAEKIQALTRQTIKLDLNEILQFPGILNQEANPNDILASAINGEFQSLIDDLLNSQQAEGGKIAIILKQKTAALNDLSQTLSPLITKASAEYKQKLNNRLLEFLNESDINDTRLQQEFAFFCQKIDVTEEIDRLNAHIQELNQLLNHGGKVGKRLDFICQELNREANTFGAKSISIATSQSAVELKVLIEQVREQVQNLM